MNEALTVPPMILSDRSLTIFINGTALTCDVSHPRWDAIKEALTDGNYSDIPNLIDIEKAVSEYVSCTGDVTVEDGVVYHNGEMMHNGLTDRILQMMNEGLDIDPMVNFLEKVEENPSSRAVNELYGFLEYGKMPITSDGHFLAYKRIRENWNDVHSNSIDNSVGQIVSMPRNKVDDDSHRTCSTGLHVCSLEYLQKFWGERVVAVKIHPKDVVSVPIDYNNTKMRVCRYEVVAELDSKLVTPQWEQSVVDQYDNTEEEDGGHDCPNCGSTVYDSQSYCEDCGAYLD